ncbi:MAG: hypothetical protein PHY28_01995 [Dehalococcoidales bacterium]|nr:hypothetical protein [Dehalococcoidales bacterium]
MPLIVQVQITLPRKQENVVNWVVNGGNSDEAHDKSARIPQADMLKRADARKSAYHYICDRLSRIPPGMIDVKENLVIPMDELRMLKEGLADPTPEMIALIKRIFSPLMINETEIEDYLVNPFQEYQ